MQNLEIIKIRAGVSDHTESAWGQGLPCCKPFERQSDSFEATSTQHGNTKFTFATSDSAACSMGQSSIMN